jgi:hypothetical protein
VRSGPAEEEIEMLDEVEGRFSALTKAAADLNAASDALTAWLREVEDRLAALRLGVGVILDKPLFDAPDDTEEEPESMEELDQDGEGFLYHGTAHYLGYGKVGTRWRFIVRSFESAWVWCPGTVFVGDSEVGWDDRKNVREKPLLDSSRELRLAAAKQIGELLDVITARAREHVDSLNQVIHAKTLADAGSRGEPSGTAGTGPAQDAPVTDQAGDLIKLARLGGAGRARQKKSRQK